MRTICDRCAVRRAQEADLKAYREQRRLEYIARYHFDDPNELYSGMTLDAYKPKTALQRAAKKAVEELCQGWLTNGFSGGLILYSPKGNVGVGKTHLAVAAARFAAEHLQSISIWGMPAYLSSLKAAYDNGGADKVQASAIDPQVLVMDDVGAENVGKAEWYEELVYSIVDTRWLKRRAIIVTTNMPKLVLIQRVGVRAASRLFAITGEPLELDGTDYRNTKGAKK